MPLQTYKVLTDNGTHFTTPGNTCDPAWKSDPLMEWAPWGGQ